MKFLIRIETNGDDSQVWVIADHSMTWIILQAQSIIWVKDLGFMHLHKYLRKDLHVGFVAV